MVTDVDNDDDNDDDDYNHDVTGPFVETTITEYRRVEDGNATNHHNRLDDGNDDGSHDSGPPPLIPRSELYSNDSDDADFEEDDDDDDDVPFDAPGMELFRSMALRSMMEAAIGEVFDTLNVGPYDPLRDRKLKCPVCLEVYVDYHDTDHPNRRPARRHPASQCSHGATMLFVRVESCPICMEDNVLGVALPCGHVVCREDFVRLGGIIGERTASHPEPLRVPNDKESPAGRGDNDNDNTNDDANTNDSSNGRTGPRRTRRGGPDPFEDPDFQRQFIRDTVERITHEFHGDVLVGGGILGSEGDFRSFPRTFLFGQTNTNDQPPPPRRRHRPDDERQEEDSQSSSMPELVEHPPVNDGSHDGFSDPATAATSNPPPLMDRTAGINDDDDDAVSPLNHPRRSPSSPPQSRNERTTVDDPSDNSDGDRDDQPDGPPPLTGPAAHWFSNGPTTPQVTIWGHILSSGVGPVSLNGDGHADNTDRFSQTIRHFMQEYNAEDDHDDDDNENDDDDDEEPYPRISLFD